MTLPNATMQVAACARNLDPSGSELRSTILFAEGSGRATRARRPSELATHEPPRGQEAAPVETLEDRDRNLVAAWAVRPGPSGETGLARETPTARIYQFGRSPMQSGRARESNWLLTFDPRYGTETDFLMGWTGSRDTLQQVELRFSTLEEAVAFAKRCELDYVVDTPRRRKFRPKSYADNFRHDRLVPWTH